MDLDDFKSDEVILNDDVMWDTLIAYFDEGVFKWLNLMTSFFSYFESDTKQTKVREAGKREIAFNKKMIVERLIKVKHF